MRTEQTCFYTLSLFLEDEIQKKYENWICDWMDSKRINLSWISSFFFCSNGKMQKNLKEKTNIMTSKGDDRVHFCLTVWYSFLQQVDKTFSCYNLLWFFSSSSCFGTWTGTDGVFFRCCCSFIALNAYSILIGINNLWNIFYWYQYWFISN